MSENPVTHLWGKTVITKKQHRWETYIHIYILTSIHTDIHTYAKGLFLMYLRAYHVTLLEKVMVMMVKKLTVRKIKYRPKSKRSKTLATIFHSWVSLLPWMWWSICCRMAWRSLLSFLSSVKAWSSGFPGGGPSKTLWRSLEEMVLAVTAAENHRFNN